MPMAAIWNCGDQRCSMSYIGWWVRDMGPFLWALGTVESREGKGPATGHPGSSLLLLTWLPGISRPLHQVLRAWCALQAHWLCERSPSRPGARPAGEPDWVPSKHRRCPSLGGHTEPLSTVFTGKQALTSVKGVTRAWVGLCAEQQMEPGAGKPPLLAGGSAVLGFSTTSRNAALAWPPPTPSEQQEAARARARPTVKRGAPCRGPGSDFGLQPLGDRAACVPGPAGRLPFQRGGLASVGDSKLGP